MSSPPEWWFAQLRRELAAIREAQRLRRNHQATERAEVDGVGTPSGQDADPRP